MSASLASGLAPNFCQQHNTQLLSSGWKDFLVQQTSLALKFQLGLGSGLFLLSPVDMDKVILICSYCYTERLVRLLVPGIHSSHLKLWNFCQEQRGFFTIIVSE